LDLSGDIYGSTEHGGGSFDCGAVFELSPSAEGVWQERILHSFTGPDGAAPDTLVFDEEGDLYSVAGYDGAYDVGVAFKLTPASGGTWNDTTLYNFQGAPDGALPTSGLVLNGGNLYGTTDVGGNGFGTIFELTPDGGDWAESVIYRFTGGKAGSGPGGPLLVDKAGNLYGNGGGTASCKKRAGACGDLFELVSTAGGQWKLRVLYTFTGGEDGAFGGASTFDSSGNLYGIAAEGGNLQCAGGGGQGCGVVFEMTP
jgi:uncharacterized repeat protein (TIGR03803 family)